MAQAVGSRSPLSLGPISCLLPNRAASSFPWCYGHDLKNGQAQRKQQDQCQIKWVSNFIWNIADNRLCNVYERDKYRDVILPFLVLQLLDAVLGLTKQAVLERKRLLDKNGIAEQDGALRIAAGQAFYNVSDFMLTKLKSSTTGQRLHDDFIAFLGGF